MSTLNPNRVIPTIRWITAIFWRLATTATLVERPNAILMMTDILFRLCGRIAKITLASPKTGASGGVTEEGKRTIEVLNLNHRPLVERRKAQFENCLRMAQCMGKEWVQREYIQPKGGVLSQYADMAAYFYRQGMFDKEVCG